MEDTRHTRKSSAPAHLRANTVLAVLGVERGLLRTVPSMEASLGWKDSPDHPHLGNETVAGEAGGAMT